MKPTNHDLSKITTNMIKEVYSGRPGCGCGCRGKYSTTKQAKTRILNVLKANPEKVRQHMGLDNEYIFALETEQRYRWVYVNLRKVKK